MQNHTNFITSHQLPRYSATDDVRKCEMAPKIYSREIGFYSSKIYSLNLDSVSKRQYLTERKFYVIFWHTEVFSEMVQSIYKE